MAKTMTDPITSTEIFEFIKSGNEEVQSAWQSALDAIEAAHIDMSHIERGPKDNKGKDYKWFGILDLHSVIENLEQARAELDDFMDAFLEPRRAASARLIQDGGHPAH